MHSRSQSPPRRLNDWRENFLNDTEIILSDTFWRQHGSKWSSSWRGERVQISAADHSRSRRQCSSSSMFYSASSRFCTHGRKQTRSRFITNRRHTNVPSSSQTNRKCFSAQPETDSELRTRRSEWLRVQQWIVRNTTHRRTMAGAWLANTFSSFTKSASTTVCVERWSLRPRRAAVRPRRHANRIASDSSWPAGARFRRRQRDVAGSCALVLLDLNVPKWIPGVGPAEWNPLRTKANFERRGSGISFWREPFSTGFGMQRCIEYDLSMNYEVTVELINVNNPTC